MSIHSGHKSKKHRALIAVLCVLLAAGVLASVLLRNGAQTAAVKVQTTTLKKTDLQSSVSVSGTVKSKTSQNVYTTLTYPVKEVRAAIGDQVKAGDILAVLDTSSLAKDVESAKYTAQDTEESNRLSLEKAKADYDVQLNEYNQNSNSDLANAKAAVQSAQQDLKAEQSTYQYDKYLNETGELSKQDLEQAEYKVASLQIAYDKASAALSSTQDKVLQNLKAAKNTYEAALAKYNDKSSLVTLEKQQQELKDATIAAPVGGTVTAKNAVVGATPNGALFTIEDTQNLVVDAEVKEFDVGDVTVGKKVEIKTDATGSQKITGVVSSVAPTATDSTKGTSNVTFATEIKMTERNPKVKAGMTAKMNIILAEKTNVYAVPYDAVLHKADGTVYIFAAEKDQGGKTYRAKEVPVNTGLETDAYIQISAETLRDGMQVVSEPENVTAGSVLLV